MYYKSLSYRFSDCRMQKFKNYSFYYQGLLGPEPSRHGLPEYRSRGLLPTPGPPLDPTRFLGLRGGRFPIPGGPRMRHPMGGQRMPGGPMGRGGMPNRFPLPNQNQVSS